MKKKIIFILILFLPLFVKASYKVSVDDTTIGEYGTYNEAKNKMLNTENSIVYKNDKIINAKYAIFKLNPGSIVKLYINKTDNNPYTSTHASYGSDAAFIDYDEQANRVKIKISGFTGWTDLSYGNIIPLTYASGSFISVSGSGIYLRKDPAKGNNKLGSISGSYFFTYYDSKINDGYTWYKIKYNNTIGWMACDPSWCSKENNSLETYYNNYSKTGNLIHHYAYYEGTEDKNTFVNLGPAPNYLIGDKIYYSFDSNYFYDNLKTMLNDYRNDTIDNSVNKNNPFIPYYSSLTVHTKTSYNASDLDKMITNTSSKLYGQGKYFIESQEKYGVNALLSFATARNESANGTSKIAIDKNNVFGYGASDSNPYDNAYKYDSVRDSIMDYAKNSLGSFSTINGKYYYGSHYGNKASGKNVMYASDPFWGEKMGHYALMTDKEYNYKDYMVNTLGITKYNKTNIKVYQDEKGQKLLYTLSHQNIPVKSMIVNVVEKIGSYYKITNDLTTPKYGYISVNDVYLNNQSPNINVSDKEININTNFNPLEEVTASDPEDGNLTNKIKYTGNVNTNNEGTYPITYSVTDKNNMTFTKKINVKVKNDNKPVIEASDQETIQYKEFDYLKNVKAYLNNEDITDKLTFEKTVDTNKIGTYDVTYKVDNISKTIKVNVIENKKPQINASDQEINLNSSFDPLENIKAIDPEDGDLTNKITYTGEVDTSKIGKYQITYKVKDNDNQETTKEITISVIKKEPQEVKGLSYIEYIKNINNKLTIKGYNTINGIDNNLNTNITYKIIFVSEDGKTYEEGATRITDKNEINRPVPSLDNKDYTYSWYKLEINLDDLLPGNYKMYIQSTSNNYYSKNLISNKTNSYITPSFNDQKYVILRNNYNKEGSPVELIIRNKKLSDKTSGMYYNQYSLFRDLSIKNQKLHIIGTTYSYGMNLASNQNVKRQIIFENNETYETYTYQIGSITNGLYKVALPVDDNLDKTRAWFDATIDLKDLKEGTYTIYLATQSNISDIYELTEKLNRDVSKYKDEFDNIDYAFKVDYNKDNRLELIIKTTN